MAFLKVSLGSFIALCGAEDDHVASSGIGVFGLGFSGAFTMVYGIIVAVDSREACVHEDGDMVEAKVTKQGVEFVKRNAMLG